MGKRIIWTDQARVDVRGIDRQAAMQILRTLARYALKGHGDIKQIQGVEPPLLRLRAQDYRVLFRDKSDYLEITRVVDRKEAYR